MLGIRDEGFALSAQAMQRVAGDPTSKASHPLHIRELYRTHNLDVHGIAHISAMTLQRFALITRLLLWERSLAFCLGLAS
jgi:hypothetical protein